MSVLEFWEKKGFWLSHLNECPELLCGLSCNHRWSQTIPMRRMGFWVMLKFEWSQYVRKKEKEKKERVFGDWQNTEIYVYHRITDWFNTENGLTTTSQPRKNLWFPWNVYKTQKLWSLYRCFTRSLLICIMIARKWVHTFWNASIKAEWCSHWISKQARIQKKYFLRPICNSPTILLLQNARELSCMYVPVIVQNVNFGSIQTAKWSNWMLVS